MSAERPFRDALLDAALDIPEGLVDGAGRPAGRRYNVYRNNIAVSLTEALETGFPAVAKLLGPENFKGLAGIYLRQSPPENQRMMFYGADFPNFLEGFEALAKYPYLGDVARLEFALRESYHAADHTSLDPAALAVDQEALMALRLALAPSVKVLSSQWPIHALWAFNMAGGPKPQAGGQDVVILRAEFDPTPHPLPPGGLAFLRHLDGQTRLEAAIGAALSIDPQFDLAALLTLLLSHSALQGSKT